VHGKIFYQKVTVWGVLMGGILSPIVEVPKLKEVRELQLVVAH
jgi:hypothetical protein